MYNIDKEKEIKEVSNIMKRNPLVRHIKDFLRSLPPNI